MQMNVKHSLIVGASLMLLGVGNAPGQQVSAQQAPAAPPSKFRLMTSAFSDGGMIPTQFSCADPNTSSPALQWSNPPEATVSFALIFHDTDRAPAKGTMDNTHWIFWNVPASATSLAGNMKPDSSPDGIVQGKNLRNVNGYQPPCPPPGAAVHHYVYELYALDTKVDLPAGSTRTDLLKTMDGHVIGKATYVGLFSR